MKRLKILTPTYYALFAHDYSYAIKIYYNKINEDELDIKEINSIAAASSLLLENKEANLKKYLKYRKGDDSIDKKSMVLIDNLVKAYEFAQRKELNAANILKAHSILSKSILPPKQRGKLRSTRYEIKSQSFERIYSAPFPEQLEKYFASIVNDIRILFKREMRLNLCFYYASYLHLGFQHISPFYDGNGVMSRLLEKWFLASKLDRRAWFIPSEDYYYNNSKLYYENLAKTGSDFKSVDNEKALEFSLMFTQSLEIDTPVE